LDDGTADVVLGPGHELAVARATIARHGGSLLFESMEGGDSTFIVRLPLDEVQARSAA
jgi:signal transduction histidine kinase